MVAGIAAASIIAYLAALLGMQKRQVYQQIVFLLIYIIGITALAEMDVVLPVYFLISLFPFLIRMERMSFFSIIVYIYFGCYLLFGLLFQNTLATCITFIGKYWQFIIFFIVIDAKIDPKAKASVGQLQIALIVESLIGGYLLLTNSEVEENGMVRLTSGAQPITGNIAVAILPICIYLYFKNKGVPRIETRIIILEALFGMWIILSGTRGYTLLFFLVMIPIFYDYFIRNRRSGRNAAHTRFMILAFVCWMFLLLVILIPSFSGQIVSILRLSDSGGIRSYENAAEWQFFWNAPWGVKLFGIGMGGTPGRYGAYVDAITAQIAKGMWNQEVYLYEAGSLYHNFFANLILNMGLLGLIVISIMNILIWKKTGQICGQNATEKWAFHLYHIGFLLMNWFRWPAECGIAEIVFYGLLLKLIERENQNNSAPNKPNKKRRMREPL